MKRYTKLSRFDLKGFLIKVQFVFFNGILIINLFSQEEFSFTLNFEDSNGDKDSIILGFDQNATDSVDEEFGEIDIKSTPWNSDLEVRIANSRGWPLDSEYLLPNFQLKKQITPNQFKYYIEPFPINVLEIHTNNWPVKVSWDSSLFDDPQINGTFITGLAPVSWWDVGTGSSGLDVAILMDTSNVSINSQVDESGRFAISDIYINEMGDTISLFWFAFSDTTVHYISPILPKQFSKDIDFGPQIKVETFSSDFWGRFYNIQGKRLNFQQSRVVIINKP